MTRRRFDSTTSAGMMSSGKYAMKVTDDDAQAALAGHMLERRALLARQHQPAPFRARQRGGAILLVHAMPFALRHVPTYAATAVPFRSSRGW